MTMDELRCFVKEAKWTFAKSMPPTPHEYPSCARTTLFLSAWSFYVRQVGYHQVGQDHLHLPRH